MKMSTLFGSTYICEQTFSFMKLMKTQMRSRLTDEHLHLFERLLKKHICSSIPATLDPLQFAYRPNRSTDDAISQVLHSSLTHIDSKNGNYVRLLFIDYSSAFNTIVPTKLAVKLSDLGLNTSLCDWIQDFLTARPQVVKVGQFTSNSITLNIGAPQGCVLSPLLYSLYTHDCVSSHSSTSIIKFADDTVVLGLINNDDETAYLDEVERLTSWCQDNCLSLNVSKTKELIMDRYTVFAHPICFAHLTVLLFCTFLYSITHFTLYFYFFTYIYIYIYIYMLLCGVTFIYIYFNSLHCPLSGPDLTYISLLIIPCIIYHVTNKETLNLDQSLRLAVTGMEPDIGHLTIQKQAHSSH